MDLALRWTTSTFILEMDYVEVIALINEKASNVSRYALRVNVIGDLIRESVQVAKIRGMMSPIIPPVV